ncbi:SusC/RagA family TonB-linked outer membrane protein [Marinifilum flexuosum]|uniref:SusC/RagA family TonB-linked outer membrane protein n=1 Tax=Marinifilum flexuosum TaxID=1117708 RepID=UPI0024954E75|nr:TonB-dependent receptor [Marinifilum flexuosum]
MKKSLVSMLILFFVGLQGVLAQNREISGVVTAAEDGLSVPGVSVIVKGTTIGTTTDFDGKYSLNVPEGENVLVFSFVGMTTQEVAITGSTLNVVMENESIGVEEVMVVAYGVAKKSSFTGSAATVDADALKDTPVTSFEKALSGNVPGLQVSSASGQPGAATEIRIRGIGSFSADQNPLYVIDGVPVTTTSTGVKYSGEEGSTTTPLSTINPADIESVTVLKDAAAASLYGSRAANGVIVITTKQGKSGKTKFNFSTSHGITDLAMDNFETVSGEEFIMLQREGMMNTAIDKKGLTGTAAEDYVNTEMAKYFPTPANGKFTDWDDELLRQGQIHNYELSASGGNEKTTFFASVSANQTDGVARNSDMERVTGRLNLTHKATDKLTLNTNISLGSVKQNIALGGSYYANPFASSRLFLLPTDMVKNEDGSYTERSRFGFYNMVREYSLNERSSDTWRNTINSSLKYDIIEGLTFKTTFSYDWLNTDNLIYSSPLSRAGKANKGEVYRRNNKNMVMTSSNILTYDKTINEQHHFNVLLGYEVEENRRKSSTAEGYNVPQGIKVNDGAAKPNTVSGYDDKSTLLSYIGKIDYDFMNKYYISASIRRDGSSKLGDDERWANFWSVSGSWRMTQEEFLSGVEWLDDLKVRASYGTNGTLPVDWYAHQALYSVNAYNGEPALDYSQISNAELSWEESKNLNIGTDFRIFSRINGSFEYFVKKTESMLMEVPLSRVTGFSSMWQNIGEMENKGWEFTLNADILKDSELKWNTSLNLSHYKNEITKLSNGETIFDFPYIRKEGEAYNTFYLRDWAGVDPTDGASQWYVQEDGKRAKDENGNFIKTKNPGAAAKAIVGKADPKLQGGINNSLSYKGFNLNFLFNFSLGGDVYNHAGYSQWSDGNEHAYAIGKDQLKRWQNAGDNTNMPKRYYDSDTRSNWNSSRRVLKNDYLRLKSLTLGYNLPKAWIEKMSIANAKIYFTGTNLLTFSSQDVFDVEQPVHGSTTWEIPTVKTYMIGLNIGF